MSPETARRERRLLLGMALAMAVLLLAAGYGLRAVLG